jgi:hypothetical protein
MAAYAVEVKRMDKDHTFGEIIALEELAREFNRLRGDVQRGFEILRAVLQLNGQREF